MQRVLLVRFTTKMNKNVKSNRGTSYCELEANPNPFKYSSTRFYSRIPQTFLNLLLVSLIQLFRLFFFWLVRIYFKPVASNYKHDCQRKLFKLGALRKSFQNEMKILVKGLFTPFNNRIKFVGLFKRQFSQMTFVNVIGEKECFNRFSIIDFRHISKHLAERVTTKLSGTFNLM